MAKHWLLFFGLVACWPPFTQAGNSLPDDRGDCGSWCTGAKVSLVSPVCVSHHIDMHKDDMRTLDVSSLGYEFVELQSYHHDFTALLLRMAIHISGLLNESRQLINYACDRYRHQSPSPAGICWPWTQIMLMALIIDASTLSNSKGGTARARLRQPPSCSWLATRFTAGVWTTPPLPLTGWLGIALRHAALGESWSKIFGVQRKAEHLENWTWLGGI